MSTRAADVEVLAPCREEQCKRLGIHEEHPWDFYTMPRGAWVPCPACSRHGEGEGPCGACGEVRSVPRRRAKEIIRELTGGSK